MKKRNESNSKSSADKRSASKSSKRRSGESVRSRRLSLEGLESRQLMAGDIPPLVGGLNLSPFDGPRNVGTVAAFNVAETEGSTQTGENNFIFTAQPVPLGNLPGQQNTIDLSGTLPFETIPNSIPVQINSDIDTFSFELQAGDILDISAFGAAGSIDVLYGPGTDRPVGSLWFATNQPQGAFYPADSPLQTTGNVSAAQVVPSTGTYYLQVSSLGTTSNYNLGLRTYRPISESLPVGQQQIIFLDFNGGSAPASSLFPGAGGQFRIPSLQDSLPLLGIDPINEIIFADQLDALTNALIDDIVAMVEEHFVSVAVNGTNGDFTTTGTPGDYGVRILNSRDHFEFDPQLNPAFQSITTHVLIGGTNQDIGFDGGLLGVSTTLDIGNFSLDDVVFSPLDGVVDFSTQFDIANTTSVLDIVARTIAITASHEAGHSFGLRHTNGNNLNPTIIEGVGTNTVLFDLGAGPDGIVGTFDDTSIDFREDEFDPGEGFVGKQRVAAALAHSLSSGTVGGSAVSGSVFSDLNRNGVRNAGEVGISGVTVFADINGNGVLDSADFQTTTQADGSFAVTLPSGDFNVIAVAPGGAIATTSTSLAGSGANLVFGFSPGGTSGSSSLGTVYSDINGNGVADPGEGIPDAYVFLDLDGDGRADLFEPNTRTASDGTYNLAFPSQGTFSIIAIPPAQFSITDPSSGNRVVGFSSAGVSGNADFIVESSLDYGDAPDTYGTTDSANGASHGIVAGLSLGVNVDRETNGQPSFDALGDDANGIDDEDGVTLVTPLGLGSTGNFAVTVTNTTGSPAFLQGFMDFNGDGDFTDPGEQFTTDQLIPSGFAAQTVNVSAAVPATATPGNTFARFRLSLSQGVGATGFVGSGEVEDYAFNIQNRADILNPDPTVGDPVSEAMFTVSRNTLSNPLNVLANDFEIASNPLRIDTLDLSGTAGVVVVGSGGRTIDYTPPNGFTGLDRFRYSVIDSFNNPVLDASGNRQFVTVTVNVTFQSEVPIAVDDSFEVPQGSVNRPLNVLDNDVASVFGGLTITSVTPGSNGGNIQIIGGGQSLRYTPLPNFSGTEQFTYSIQDTANPPNVSTAQVTINMTPGSRDDDVVEYRLEILDPVNRLPVTNVQAGDEFLVEVTANDLRDTVFTDREGVASAFLDLLYTDELVSPIQVDPTTNDGFSFDINFGPAFAPTIVNEDLVVDENGDFLDAASSANARTPGVFSEIGGTQTIDTTRQVTEPQFLLVLDENGNEQSVAIPESEQGEVLFTIRMTAIAPGVAQFVADPSDTLVAETIALDSDTALEVSQIRLGNAELIIFPGSGSFTSAIDDGFSNGLDSLGSLIENEATRPNRLDVLSNDNLGPTDSIREFGLVTNPTFGTVTIDVNGTPDNPNDDFFSYRANANANGLERFTYFIVTEDGVSSTAEVTIPLGNTNSNALVAMNLSLVNATFNSTTGRFEPGAAIPTGSSVSVGQTFGVQIQLDDLTQFVDTFVFAGFLDLLYSSDTIRPVAGVSGTEFDFDVNFGPGYEEAAGVGTAARLGIIDEFGSVTTEPLDKGSDPAVLATVFFEAVSRGPIRIAGSPADSSPFQDTLLFNQDLPVEVSQIRYDVLTTTVVSNGEGESIQNPVLPQDVNNDGAVSPIDALLIINRMGRSASLGEGESIVSPSPNIYYTDVNGDNETSAIDALQVINYLARNANRAEGEMVAVPAATLLPQAAADDNETVAPVSDSVFAELSNVPNNSTKLLSTESSTAADSATIVSGQQANSEANVDDDDDDDVLDLLADDVRGRWS